MFIMLNVSVDCSGKEDEVLEVFKAYVMELKATFPLAFASNSYLKMLLSPESALRKTDVEMRPYLELVPGKDDLALLHLPVLETEVDKVKDFVGPIWRRIAYQKGKLPQKVIETMRKNGDLPIVNK